MTKVSDVVAPYLAQRVIGEVTQVLAEPWLIPKSWKWAKMGDVTTIVGGGTPKTSEPANFGGDIPWITPADLSGYTDKYIERGARNITEAGLANSGARLMPAGTVLFSSRAPIGYVAIASQAVATNQGFKSFVLKDELLPEFVYYWLQCAKPIAIKLASGTTFLEISGKKASEIPIPVPPLDVQHRIVAEIEEQLSRLEAGVAALKRVQANLKRYRAAVLADAVCGKFRQIALGELARDAGYGTSVKCAYSPDGIGVLRIPNISSGKIDTTDMKRAPVDYAYKPDDPVEPGDLLIIRTNGSKSLIGRGAVVLEATPEPLLFASYLIRLRLNGTRTLWRWVSLALESPLIRAWIETKAASSAGQHNISLTILRSMPLPLPSASEQERILSEVDRRLSVAEELETQVHADLARSDRLRKATLQSAFQVR